MLSWPLADKRYLTAGGHHEPDGVGGVAETAEVDLATLPPIDRVQAQLEEKLAEDGPVDGDQKRPDGGRSTLRATFLRVARIASVLRQRW